MGRKRIGIDFHAFDGLFQGSRTYLIELFSRVIHLSPEYDFFLFLQETEALQNISLYFKEKNVTTIKMAHANPAKRLMLQLPMLQIKCRLDLLHSQYISPFPSFSKTVITLHDILFESHPQFFGNFFKLRSKILMRESAAKASHIFTVSEYSKDAIIKRYKMGADISVVYNGINTDRFYAGIDGEETIKNVGLKSKNYLLTVGRLEPRKNHISLIEAYCKSNIQLPLVIIGQRCFGYNQIEKKISDLKIADRVHVLENVSDADLPKFYRHARIFLYPSWAEGFGLPVIEAMASGVPVITSNTTSLAEIGGDACLMISPYNVQEINDAMRLLMDNADLSTKLIESGFNRIKTFNWNDAASKTKEIYQRIFCEH